MISTFHGLEVAKRGMQTQQSALYVTGHNISNVNTPGYSRQRVNFAQTSPFPTPGINRPQIPGQLGTGVMAKSIQRIRDSFVDTQYRSESSKLGYWQAKSEILTQVENIMNEPTDSGLAHTMDQFWNALQDLSVQPQNDGARRVVRERGIALANTFNYTYNSLQAIQKDYRNEIDVTQQNANSILRQINQINKQIGSIEPHGYLPNDLYDQRDKLIDELSSLMNIRVERKPSGGMASPEAEGQVDIYVTTPQGDVLKDKNGRQIKLIDSQSNTAVGIHIQYENRLELDSPVTGIKFFELNENGSGFKNVNTNSEADSNTSAVRYELDNFTAFNTNGRLKSFIEGYGYKDGDKLKGSFNDMLADLDQMVYTFASHFNNVHSAGWSLNEIRDGENKALDFFELPGATDSNFKGIAGKIKVSEEIIKDVQNIAAAAEGNVLAGTFNRVSSDQSKNITGNPTFTGIFEVSDASVKDNWKDVTDVTVKVQYDKTTKEWQYQLIGKDANNNEVKHPADGSFVSVAGTKAEVFGVKLDFSNVTIPTGTTDNTEWTTTFSAKGMSSKDEAFIGNGSNALKLAEVKDAVLSYGGNLTNVHSFYQGVIGKLGDNTSEALRMEDTATIMRDSVDFRRMSISNVSLDEEMANMVKFQHAYNASARNITMIDEMLDKIINGMGIVGR